MSEDCDRCKNIKLYYNTNKGRGGNRTTQTARIKTVAPRSIYLILHNDKIIRFCVSKKEGMKYMRELARVRILNYTPNYKTYIEEMGNMIRITGMHRFFIISYEKILDDFELIKVNGIPNIAAQYEVFKPIEKKVDKVKEQQTKRHSKMLKEIVKVCSKSDVLESKESEATNVGDVKE